MKDQEWLCVVIIVFFIGHWFGERSREGLSGRKLTADVTQTGVEGAGCHEAAAAAIGFEEFTEGACFVKDGYDFGEIVS